MTALVVVVIALAVAGCIVTAFWHGSRLIDEALADAGGDDDAEADFERHVESAFAVVEHGPGCTCWPCCERRSRRLRDLTRFVLDEAARRCVWTAADDAAVAELLGGGA